MTRPDHFDDNLAELRDALKADAAAVGEALLGPPNRATSTAATMRWGTKGSLALEVRGPRRGAWYDHEAAEGGDLLALVRRSRASSFPEAVEWARTWTGLPGAGEAQDGTQDAGRRAQQEADRRARRAEQKQQDAVAAAAQKARGIATARAIASACVPLNGTVADYYLKQNRGVAPGPDGWPDAIRFHPKHRALVAIATTADETVQAVQRVHLDAEGAKVGPAEMAARDIKAVKQTNGALEGAAVRLPGPADGPLLLAEGPETALAAWSATGHETWAALGSLSKLTLPAGRRILVLRDDDKPYSPADHQLTASTNAWRRAGVPVVVVTPWPARRWDGSDLADVILAIGAHAVRGRIEAALPLATPAVQRVPVEEARVIVGQAVAGFFARVDAASIRSAQLEDGQEDPEPNVFTHAVRVDVGVGKSHEARIQAAELLTAMQARGDTRTVVLAVPFHALGDEQAAAFMALPAARAAGLRAAAWRGRAAPDPAAPGYTDPTIERANKTPMCRQPDRVHDAQEVGLEVQASACRRRIKTEDGKQWVTCPSFDTCAYQRQRLCSADLWIVAHEMLFVAKPAAVGDVAAVIVDESAWQCGLEGVHGWPMALPLASLTETTGLPERLEFLRVRLLEVLEAAPDGPLSRAALVGSTLLEGSAAEAIALEWSLKVDPKMHPAMTPEERREAKQAARANKGIPRFAMLWRAVRALLAADGPEKSGWVELATVEGRDGPVRALLLKGRRAVTAGWKAPTLLLDALLPLDLVRPFWSDVVLTGEAMADALHQHVCQVTDRAYAKSMLMPLDEASAEADPEEARRRARNLRDLRAILFREARLRAPGKVLTVLQKDVRSALVALGPLPANLELAHHNNIAGRDEWRDVAALIVVGRTMPAPGSAERLAEALTGRATPAPVVRYSRADAMREVRDGTLLPADADRHPDPVTEAIRWQIAEGELLQIIGRARGVNRTAANPVQVLVMTDLPLPLPIDRTIMAAELDPSPADLMLAAGGVALENAADVAAAYPQLWATRDAAKLALHRWRVKEGSQAEVGIIPHREETLIWGMIPTSRGLASVRYQRAGAGKSPATAHCDLDRVPDPAAWLAQRLGLLIWCRPTPPDRPDNPPPRPSPPDPDLIQKEQPMQDHHADRLAAEIAGGAALQLAAETAPPAMLLDPGMVYARIPAARLFASPPSNLLTFGRSRDIGPCGIPWQATGSGRQSAASAP